jgi:hypothetical protein
MGRLGEFFPAEDHPRVSHLTDKLYKLHRVYIKDALGLGLVAERLVVAAQTEDIADAQGGCAEDIGLQGDTVPVAGYHLEYGVKTTVQKQHAGGEAGETDNACLVVGNVDAVDKAFEHLSLLFYDLRISPLGRTALCGNGKGASLQDLFQTALSLHIR